MRHRTSGLLALLLALVLAAGASPSAAQSGARCFTETDLCVDGRFLGYWSGNGGLPVFGLPLSEQRTELGSEGAFSTQWFERERFEAHPENRAPYDVLLGRLGDEALRRQGRDWQSFPKGAQQPGCQFFAATGHSVCEPFLSYWRSHGLEFDGRRGTSYEESLALFGLPLSEPAMETNSSGFTVLTQWYERARFEYLPQNPDPYKVLLGRLGAEVFDPTAGNGPTQYHAVQQPGWPHPLEVPVGFTIEEVASDIPSPRFMTVDPFSNGLIYGSSTTSQVVRLIDDNGDGRYDRHQIVAAGLTAVHSVLYTSVGGTGGVPVLYAAAEDRLVTLSNFDANGMARDISTLLPLPGGAKDLYGHRTRTLARGPDGKLYISVGSSCDVCVEDTPLRATILRMNTDGSGVEVFASGLRNTVGFDWRPFSSELWGVDMGRNNIGQGTPPDELNRLEQGKDYGWPYCYGDSLPNPEFNDPARCAAAVKPALNLPAHWAPLGMLFYKGTNFPASYQGDAIVAYHGTARDQVQQLGGYNVVRIRFKNGRPVASEDLVRGWLVGDESWGRPAGLLALGDGSLLISDDASARIYRLRYVGR
jgi:glucose/arabinose dehydrogenase